MIHRCLPRAGFRDLDPAEALELGLEQVSRWRWQMLEVEWFGFGIGLYVRALPKDAS